MESVIKLVLGFAFIVLVAALGFEINQQATSENYVRLKNNLEEVQSGNAIIAKKNDLLRVKIESLREDPRAIERKVRDELGLVRPDEIVVFLRDENGNLVDWGTPGQRLVETPPTSLPNVDALPDQTDDSEGTMLFDNAEPSLGIIEDTSVQPDEGVSGAAK